MFNDNASVEYITQWRTNCRSPREIMAVQPGYYRGVIGVEFFFSNLLPVGIAPSDIINYVYGPKIRLKRP